MLRVSCAFGMNGLLFDCSFFFFSFATGRFHVYIVFSCGFELPCYMFLGLGRPLIGVSIRFLGMIKLEALRDKDYSLMDSTLRMKLSNHILHITDSECNNKQLEESEEMKTNGPSQPYPH